MSEAKPSIAIDVVSDVVCPWCFLGKRRLEAALASLPEIDATIRWRPYQLDPSVPPGGLPRDVYMKAKFGDVARFAKAEARLAEMGKAEGAPYRFDRITRAPNTIDAHRLVRWTSEIGQEEPAVEALFNAHFVEGRDVGDHETLAEIGASLGLDAATTLRRLYSSESVEDVKSEIASARQIGVTGVPTFILIGRYGVVGAQSADTLAGAIRKAADELAGGPALQPG